MCVHPGRRARKSATFSSTVRRIARRTQWLCPFMRAGASRIKSGLSGGTLFTVALLAALALPAKPVGAQQAWPARPVKKWAGVLRKSGIKAQ